jgi:hypothetical protein
MVIIISKILGNILSNGSLPKKSSAKKFFEEKAEAIFGTDNNYYRRKNSN